MDDGDATHRERVNGQLAWLMAGGEADLWTFRHDVRLENSRVLSVFLLRCIYTLRQRGQGIQCQVPRGSDSFSTSSE